ncbi:MAG: ribonuclease Y [Propionibacteriaceae bacterium]|nr:ribonuclease Y [Propionibacteriaceae bacterium]
MGGWEILQLVVLGLVLTATVGLSLTVRRSRQAGAERERERLEWREEERARLEQELAQLRAVAEKRAETTRSTADELMREVEAARDEVRRARADHEQQQHQAARELDLQRAEIRELRAAGDRRDQRLAVREERLDAEAHLLEERAGNLDQRQRELDARERDLAEREDERRAELERVGELTGEAARAELVREIEQEARRNGVVLARKIEDDAQREAETRAQRLIVSTIQRVASEQTAESVVSTVELPGDEMKGRIIGREGRNIRAFEQITGVNVMIDDTPGSVLLSCFDPVRRETARLTLTELVADGRIHPARIEEVFERSRGRIADRCVRAAEDALVDVGISDLHPELIPVLGALRYRTSYGQNVLKHLIECAHLAGVMAAELRLDVAACKRAAFLHDIGKALTHEVEGTHAIIGANLARKYGEHPDIVHAIEAHHNEVEPRTVEAILTQACDAISGSRPGARRESLESYVHRLERLEEIAGGHPGVEKVFAMQAGREVRVMVSPEHVDDIEAQILARDIVKQIEEELTYPGNIRVTVVRESRATELAR